MAVASALFVILQAVGFTTEIPYLREMTTAFLGFLAVSGLIVKPPTSHTDEVPVKEENKEDERGATQNASVTEIIDEILDNTQK